MNNRTTIDEGGKERVMAKKWRPTKRMFFLVTPDRVVAESPTVVWPRYLKSQASKPCEVYVGRLMTSEELWPSKPALRTKRKAVKR